MFTTNSELFEKRARAKALNAAPDSIPGMFKPGEFVLPPDTVHAMGGKQALQGVVDATHTPVASFGLNAPRASAPQAKAAPQLGFKPEVFFANGGAPEDQLAKRAAVSPSNTFPQASPSAGANIYAGAGLSRDKFGSSGKIAQIPAGIGGNPAAPARPAIQSPTAKPNSFGDAAAASSNAGVAPIQEATPKATPTAAPAPAATRTPGASELYMQDRAQEMGSQWNAGNYAQAAGTAGRTAVQGLGMYGIELADKALTPVGNAIGGFAKGLFGAGDAQAAPAPQSTPGAAPTATDQPAATPTGAAPGNAYVFDSSTAKDPSYAMGGAAGAAKPVPPTPTEATPTSFSTSATKVYNHGRGQYSDQAGGMGLTPSFTGRPNAQNDRAAQNLVSSQPGPQAAPAGGQPDMGGFGFNAPSVAHSGNDWAARQRLKDMETSASSITNRPEWRSGSSSSAWGSRHNHGVNDPDGKIGRFNAATQADLAAQGKQTDATLQTIGLNAGLMRESMGQQGANQRAALAESGATARANGQLGLGLGRLALDQSRAGSDDRLREPQIRAAERMGQMQEAYINAETPEQKAAIAAEMRAYSGKVEQDRWKSVALQGGTDAAGNKTESLLGAVNERTGEMKRMGGAQPSVGVVVTSDAAGRTAFAQLPSGATYTGPDGKQYRKG